MNSTVMKMPERSPRARLEGQLYEIEQRIAIYQDLLNDEPGIKTKWAILDAIDAMREHRTLVEQALDDYPN